MKTMKFYDEKSIRKEYYLQSILLYGIVRGFRKTFNKEISIMHDMEHSNPNLMRLYFVYQGVSSVLVLGFVNDLIKQGLELILT